MRKKPGEKYRSFSKMPCAKRTRKAENKGTLHQKEEAMAKVKLDLQKEWEGRGLYQTEGLWYGVPYNPVERLTTPVSPRENLLRYYRGQDYEWLPDICSDQIDITPFCNPDILASGYEGGRDAFGVKWIPVEGGELPAFVEPGFQLWEDISDWRKQPFPDPDTWNWKEEADRYNQTYQGDDRLRRGIIMSGYFERLIANMTFEEAAMALLTDPEEVTAFFEELTVFNEKVMKHYLEDFGCESIMIHDDWAAQRSPFFSLDTVMELIVPHLKKLSDAAHEQGASFTLHSCGNGLDLLPAIKASGVDAWQLQVDAVDAATAYERAGDDLILESYPVVPEELHGEKLENFLRETLQSFCGKHKGLVEFYDFDPERLAETRRLTYKVSRELALSGACR